MSQRLSKPPMGGALLECYYAYAELSPQDAITVLKAERIGLLRLSHNEPYLVADKEFSPMTTPHFDNLAQLFDWVQGTSASNVVINYDGELESVTTTINITLRFLEKVLIVSTAEDMIWAFSNDVSKAVYGRLDAFFLLCQSIADQKVPKYALIGSEPCSAKEISVSNPENGAHVPFDPVTFFSDSRKQALYQWYTTTYVSRWK